MPLGQLLPRNREADLRQKTGYWSISSVKSIAFVIVPGRIWRYYCSDGDGHIDDRLGACLAGTGRDEMQAKIETVQ